MTTPPTLPIKAFVSYSWTSPDHIAWVVELAEQLRADGIETILDQWHSKEGDDMNAFMERMVTDPTVQKVIVVCDRGYAEKADSRKGGVGIESTIISQEVYGKVAQQKFIPLVAERDEAGQPFLPVFLKSRKYIDVSDSLKREENYEALLRALADKPLRTPPPVGALPTFLSEDGAATSPTTAKRRAVESAVLGQKSTTGGVIEDYFDALRAQIGELTVAPDAFQTWDELYTLLDPKLESWTPLRNEFVALLRHILRYGQGHHLTEGLPRFFDSLLPLSYELNDSGRLSMVRFAVYEAFLYAFALLLKQNQFETAANLLRYGYRNPDNYRPNNFFSFAVFRVSTDKLDGFWNKKSGTNWEVPIAAMIQARATLDFLPFQELIEPDLVLFMAYLFRQSDDSYSFYSWYPLTIPYLERSMMSGLNLGFCERCKSRRYFDDFKVILGVDSKEELLQKWAQMASPGSYSSRVIDNEKMTARFQKFATVA